MWLVPSSFMKSSHCQTLLAIILIKWTFSIILWKLAVIHRLSSLAYFFNHEDATAVVVPPMPRPFKSIMATNEPPRGGHGQRPYLSFHRGNFAMLWSLLQKWRPTTKHKKLSVSATMHHYHRYEANRTPTWPSPTVLGRLLMVEAGGIGYLQSPQ